MSYGRNCYLLQLIEEISDRQYALLQVLVFKFDAQFVLTDHLDVAFTLNQRDDLHRVDRRIRDELDRDSLG
jgi:hypothetical protein